MTSIPPLCSQDGEDECSLEKVMTHAEFKTTVVIHGSNRLKQSELAHTRGLDKRKMIKKERRKEDRKGRKKERKKAERR